MSNEELVSVLRKVVATSADGAVNIGSDEVAQNVVDQFEGTNRISFISLDCSDVSDAPLVFWQLYKAKALADVCHVVFTSATSAKPGLIRAWQEFAQLYGGTNFGNLYLMRYNNLIKPVMVSSMKGILFK